MGWVERFRSGYRLAVDSTFDNWSGFTRPARTITLESPGGRTDNII
jgi:hypothetical protein